MSASCSGKVRGILSFGRFSLDVERRRLLRDAEPVALTDLHYDLLHQLVTRRGQVVSKEQLVETAWNGMAVTDNSLAQAVIRIRRLLAKEGVTGIETVRGRGYRFTAPVIETTPPLTHASLDRLLAPHRAWLDGRAALESLAADQIPRAREFFEAFLRDSPHEPSAHIGLANACVLQFETTRAVMPDAAALARAGHHAREACRLGPDNAEAWATLGFVLGRPGGDYHPDAVAASKRATVLEPGNWRHHVRLAATAWGNERLTAAHRAATLLPGCPLAHWLAATVHIARFALADAERELSTAIQFEASHTDGRSQLNSIALNWLMGLVQFARGDADAAVASFERELAMEASGHLYARECCANTWYAIGCVRLFQERSEEAAAAFRAALERIPIHPLAIVGLDLLGADDAAGKLDFLISAASAAGLGRPFALELACAASITRRGRGADAANRLDAALPGAMPLSEGWLIPVEPLLRVQAEAPAWSGVLARLRMRAA